MEEILLVQPKMIVTLGNFALKALCGPRAAVSRGELGTDSWRGQLRVGCGAQGLELGL